MSLAEEMLATMSASDDSSTYLAEEEPHIIIDNSRTAFVPPLLKTIAVTGDHKVEKITFDCVRFWDGNDLSTFAIYLNYVLPDFSTGTYIPSSIVADNNVFHFDWDIKNNITKKSGKISFAITAIKTKENDLGETVVDKQWSSIPNGDCSIVLGIDISNVPSEEESPDILAQMSAILENIHADIDEWIKNVLVQESGYSETKAMSQKATTLEIEKAKNDLEKEIQRNRDAIIKNSKRIENLQQGFSYQFETDSTIAYVKDVPEGSLAYAEVKKIGGITNKSENLMPLSFNPQTKSGVTFSLNKDGSVSVVGTSTSSFAFYITNQFKLSAGDYFLSGCPVGGATGNENAYSLIMEYKTGASALDLGEGKSFTMDADYSYCKVEISVAKNTVMNHTFYPMLNKGSTAIPYEPYFEGLRSAKVTEVESVGVNLIRFPYHEETKTLSGVTFTVNGDRSVTVRGTATGTSAFYLWMDYDVPLPVGYYSVIANGVCETRCYNDDGTATTFGPQGNYINVTRPIVQIALLIREGQTYNGTVYPMLNKGSTPLPYTPYFKHTLPIPAEVQALDGYGLGVSDTVYNYIDWEKKQFVKRCEKAVFDGSSDEVWELNHGTDNLFYINLPIKTGGASLCDVLPTYSYINLEVDCLCTTSAYPVLYLSLPTKLPTGSSVSALNAWLAENPLTVVYELDTPEVTDISDLISADNFIGVEGGGTLTFKNAYEYAVPSEVEYQVEV